MTGEQFKFTLEEFDRITGQLRGLLEKKGQEYNKGAIQVHNYFCHAKKSYDQMIYLKVMRELAREPLNLNLDSLFDLLNYTLFAIDFHQKENPDWWAPGIKERAGTEINPLSILDTGHGRTIR